MREETSDNKIDTSNPYSIMYWLMAENEKKLNEFEKAAYAVFLSGKLDIIRLSDGTLRHRQENEGYMLVTISAMEKLRKEFSKKKLTLPVTGDQN